MDDVLRVADVSKEALRALLGRFHAILQIQPDGEEISGSFWGDSEAGLITNTVYVRRDTPIHSLLHETCHLVCMSEERRDALNRDAGGDDLEESAVCYLQILLADQLENVGADRLMQDMDSWGYSFRLGSTRRWFNEDAEDAIAWLVEQTLVDEQRNVTFRLRR
jgi:hypothetical protein